MRRAERLATLLREVISEVIAREVRNPDVAPHTSVSRVELSKDLRHAKVYISVLGTPQEREKTVKALSDAAGFIGSTAAKQVRIRFFPELRFFPDETVDKQMEIERILQDLKDGRDTPS